jgi:hypothetical protein
MASPPSNQQRQKLMFREQVTDKAAIDPKLLDYELPPVR